VETSALQVSPTDTSLSFTVLSSAERRQLREWHSVAKVIGIDAVEDLTLRPWPCPVAETVIGIFQTGSTTARWLVIGDKGAWAVACCLEGDVSRTFESLTEALAVIYPGETGCGRTGLIC
jgi:hypothetical protein